MKYFVLIPDGMADEPHESLNHATPMEVAYKPWMDLLAAKSLCGMVSNVPRGMIPESDTANLAILSYDPRVYSRGRSPLEAVSMGIHLNDGDVAIRCNLVALSESEDYFDKTMIDHSADEITTEEASELITALDARFGGDLLRFYTGISYRHCIVWRGIDDNYPFMRPHDILGQKIKEYLPSADAGSEYLQLMRESNELLEHHPVNEKRRASGLLPANSIWLWSPGKKPSLPDFYEKWKLRGTVISAVDLIKGIGICAGLKVPFVEGATGNFKTNYGGKADAAIAAFRCGGDFVFVHVEAPDECGHRGEIDNKVRAIELIDERVLAPVYEYLRTCGEPFKIMVLPDHPTPLASRTHSMDPVPFFIYSSEKDAQGAAQFTEARCADMPLYISEGYTLMNYLLKG